MTEPVVSLRRVTVRHGVVAALREIDLEIGAGERVALVGPSGAGKTTLLSVLNGTVQPTDGSVRVLGHDPASAGRASRRRVGTVHQALDLTGPLRVVHNVNAGHLASWSLLRALRSLLRPVAVDEAMAVLARVGIADRVHERTDNLSGGERQRVAIARVLVQNPDLVLADEPISSLDPARGREVVELLGALAREADRTLVMSLHAFDLARTSCDRVVGMRDGRIVFDERAVDVTDHVADSLYRLAPRP